MIQRPDGSKPNSDQLSIAQRTGPCVDDSTSNCGSTFGCCGRGEVRGERKDKEKDYGEETAKEEKNEREGMEEKEEKEEKVEKKE